ncbi:hypothetical protein CRG98_046669 [Punica granatum]|uniref:RRM domain-containing protein n=1 Tax=Punica granatum TaxID=22663 RepID=A0A2I0HMI5_PUNGR|nr:hypothetical protein CRG98_046669 [Punica granatum]
MLEKSSEVGSGWVGAWLCSAVELSSGLVDRIPSRRNAGEVLKLSSCSTLAAAAAAGCVIIAAASETRTVQVRQLSDLATEREIHEFFSFSGEIEHVEILSEAGELRTAFVTFKDPKALEIALLLSVYWIASLARCLPVAALN